MEDSIEPQEGARRSISIHEVRSPQKCRIRVPGGLIVVAIQPRLQSLIGYHSTLAEIGRFSFQAFWFPEYHETSTGHRYTNAVSNHHAAEAGVIKLLPTTPS
jgi:hypothetical protein